jgi:putative tryptophan/tyrosine transport system substrate-binding protein
MKRREFLTLLGGAAAAWPLAARAQQPAMPVIGLLSPLSAGTAARNVAAFRQGLRDLGYLEGRNLGVEYRFAGGMTDQLGKLAAELSTFKPALVVAGSDPGILAARTVMPTVPLIVIGGNEDPIRLGFAESFARPGGNITGFLLLTDAQILGKKLGLLRDAVPGIARVGIILDPDLPGDAAELRMVPSLAGQLGLQSRVFEVRAQEELQAAFTAIAGDALQGLYVSWAPLFNARREQVIAMVANLRLPAIYGFREFVRAGGLMSYGPDLPDLYRRSAAYVDKILRGEKAAELPFQVAEKYELVINLNTAKSLGLTLPESFLLLADQVIE